MFQKVIKSDKMKKGIAIKNFHIKVSYLQNKDFS